MSAPILLARAHALLAAAGDATARPWRWWTSNSMRRLSSVPTGRDGDVLAAIVDASRETDGAAVVDVRTEDANFIEGACNSGEELAAFAVEFARALPGLYRKHADLVGAAPNAPGNVLLETCPRHDGTCACGAADHNARLDSLADKLGIPPEERRR